MHVTLITNEFDVLGSSIHLQDYLECLMRLCRQHPSATIARKSSGGFRARCHRCGIDYESEAHHIIPVWVFCLERILTSSPKTLDELLQAYQSLQDDDEFFQKVNSPNNIIPLCTRCHKKADSENYAKWKGYFEKNYFVLFGVRWFDKFFLRANGGEKISLAEVLQSYRSQRA
jgi:hypothetical protein